MELVEREEENVRTMIEGEFLFRKIRLDLRRQEGQTLSLSVSQGKLASLSQADPIPVIYISCRPLTHTHTQTA